MNISDRIEGYKQAFPNWPPPRESNSRLDGVWIMGNDYKGSGYYGSYPPNYLKRVMSMFPDKVSILHLFSGSLCAGEYIRFDYNPELKPDVVGDAERLSEYFDYTFDLVIADPPYSQSDALHYGKPMISRRKVMAECYKVMSVGGHLVWLDEVFPMFSKKEYKLYGLFPIIRSTNHRVRCCFIFEKV